ncbi:thiamine biosynthesis lipoprotein ApbE precursor [Oxobacter pfennigii]|uniref:FAD:protein FMN transferase n=1 Tax=Oxobacter pfennigii TaxID=36849 RepID=A0A0P8YAN0_9CLOT|nr:FAD:protein FMN transferase [Oxobacter pfennigii]KPU44057.1 thiamine biosynthesis lipoprotein ApbE precursor [Oxobacter pfennigii]
MKKFIYITLMMVFIFVLYGCGSDESEKIYEDTQIKMDTPMTIKAYGKNAEEAVKRAFEKIDEIERLTSVNMETSDVSKINSNAGVDYVKVDPQVFYIIKEAVRFSELSSGVFDISIGPVIKLWGIGTENARIPSQQEIYDALSLVGYKGIKLNETEQSVFLEKKGMLLDLGGIAKGYAADCVVEILKEKGVNKAIINLGGSNVTVVGEKEKDTPWAIGLQHPRKAEAGNYLAIIRESDKAISTSGDYERYFIDNGKRYHHIFNPATGYPTMSGIISDTVVLDSKLIKYSAMAGDALSTVVFVLGPEEGIKFIEGIEGVECVVATDDFKIFSTPGIEGIISSISEDFKND